MPAWGMMYSCVPTLRRVLFVLTVFILQTPRNARDSYIILLMPNESTSVLLLTLLRFF
jgi:hypothetical protein